MNAKKEDPVGLRMMHQIAGMKDAPLVAPVWA